MNRQTLEEALLRARSGRDLDMGRAAKALDGKPVGAWAETKQATRELLGYLPFRLARAYSADEFIAAAYDIRDGRYRVKS